MLFRLDCYFASVYHEYHGCFMGLDKVRPRARVSGQVFSTRQVHVKSPGVREGACLVGSLFEVQEKRVSSGMSAGHGDGNVSCQLGAQGQTTLLNPPLGGPHSLYHKLTRFSLTMI